LDPVHFRHIRSQALFAQRTGFGFLALARLLLDFRFGLRLVFSLLLLRSFSQNQFLFLPLVRLFLFPGLQFLSLLQTEGRLLQQFRQFYLLVVAYIYFTRIIVILLDAIVPFRWIWLGDLATELATVAFYLATGYMFRPAENNPYLRVDADEDTTRQIAMQEIQTGGDL